MAFKGSLAFRKVLFLNHNIRTPAFFALVIIPAAHLQPTDNADHLTFFEVFFRKLTGFAECNASDEVGILLALTFETAVDRFGKDSISANIVPWDVTPDEGFSRIPMWCADMSFVAAPPVMKAINKRLEFQSFGYFELSDEYFDSIISWQSRRNGVQGLMKEHIGYENGVLGGVSSAIQALSAPGDKILLHSPTYIGFTHVLNDIGRTAVHSPLVRDEHGVWRMDYADMDRKIKENGIHLAISCSPHNPCGRVWERWELEKAMELFKKYNVYVVSDEIWSDIILSGHKHIPTQSISEDARQRTAAMYAPSKTFNLAGLIGSYHIVYNDWWRDRINKESSLCHYNSMNVLSMHALIGAYKPEGYEWADELREVLTGNVDFAYDYIAQHFEGVKVAKPEGTYMLFVDCTDWCAAHGKTIQEVEQACWDVGAAVQDGTMFHGVTMLPPSSRSCWSSRCCTT